MGYGCLGNVWNIFLIYFPLRMNRWTNGMNVLHEWNVYVWTCVCLVCMLVRRTAANRSECDTKKPSDSWPVAASVLVLMRMYVWMLYVWIWWMRKCSLKNPKIYTHPWHDHNSIKGMSDLKVDGANGLMSSLRKVYLWKQMLTFKSALINFFEIENVQIRGITPTSTAAQAYRYVYIRWRLTHAEHEDHTYSAAAIRLNFFTKWNAWTSCTKNSFWSWNTSIMWSTVIRKRAFY